MRFPRGNFYKFQRQRNVARAGQPTQLRGGIDIGLEIDEPTARHLVNNGSDVYTSKESDALRLARSFGYGIEPSERHLPKTPTQSGRSDVYFRHFHPRGNHDLGHIFFGERGEGEATTLDS